MGSATDRKLCRCAARNESTLAEIFTMDEFGAGTLSLCRCLMEPHMNISKPSVNKSNTGVRTLISHHKRRRLVTLKILFFVEQENAWDFHCAEWERETHRKCVSLTRDAWDMAGPRHYLPSCSIGKVSRYVYGYSIQTSCSHKYP